MTDYASISRFLDRISRQLLEVNKKVFRDTGSAPKLVVYIPKTSFDLVVGDTYLLSTETSTIRDTELLQEQSIIGYPIIVTEDRDEELLSYTIGQILYSNHQ